ncbi:MAG: PilZ domain-containing protein [Oligoflexia bacterium]|nr:PilZ domain-containing protein [Oligoflexia bacterium]
MLERRNSDRILLNRIQVREVNGDYLFSYKGLNLSEEGLFLENRFCVPNQEPFSKLTFTLPNGKRLTNVTARIVREERQGARKGCAFEFLNLSEEHRIELKKCLHQLVATGTA